MYSAVPHIRFLLQGGRVPLDLRFRGPLRPNPSSGPLKSTLPGPREGSSMLDVDLVVVTAAVDHVVAKHSNMRCPVLVSERFVQDRPEIL